MAAVWGFTGPPDEHLNERMSAALMHRARGPLASHVSPNSTVCLRTDPFRQKIGPVPPALYECNAPPNVIALCGWLTGIDDQELAAAAVSPMTDGGAAFYDSLARRYRTEGAAAVRALRGAFVLIIVDGETVHLSRDGAGNRTAYFGRCGDRWLFGIEPKSITAAPEFSRRVRPAALAQYLACGFVPGMGTMLEDVFEVPAGQTVTLHAGHEPQLHRWFCFEQEEPRDQDIHLSGNGDASVWVSAFRQQMERAVSERIPRGEPVGVFLSGGLDSSIVTAELARQLGGKNVRTWSIHFGAKYPNELEFARAVAEHCGTVHEEVLIQPKHFLKRLRQMIWYLDDPIGDPITQPNYELAAVASRDVQYIFNGEGGDPCFGGPKNLPMMLHHWYGGLPREPNFRERHYLQSYRRAWEEIPLLLSEDVQRQIDDDRDLDGVFAPYLRSPTPRAFLNRLTAINLREKGAHLIQPKVERMLAAHGLTPLAPLFDERLIKLSFQMPTHLKLHRGIEKVILKLAYEKEVLST